MPRPFPYDVVRAPPDAPVASAFGCFLVFEASVPATVHGDGLRRVMAVGRAVERAGGRGVCLGAGITLAAGPPVPAAPVRVRRARGRTAPLLAPGSVAGGAVAEVDGGFGGFSGQASGRASWLLGSRDGHSQYGRDSRAA